MKALARGFRASGRQSWDLEPGRQPQAELLPFSSWARWKMAGSPQQGSELRAEVGFPSYLETWGPLMMPGEGGGPRADTSRFQA